MCIALKELMKEEIQEEIMQGKAEAKAEGVIETLISLVRDGLLSKDEGAKRAGMTLDAFNAEPVKA